MLENFSHMLDAQYNLVYVKKSSWWRHGQKVWFHNLYFKIRRPLRRPRIANYADIIKIATMFIEKTFKYSRKS